MPVLKAWDGTQWVEVAGGTEEVHVGPDAPTLSAVELWYDTDAIPTLDPAKMPRGYVGSDKTSTVVAVTTPNAWVYAGVQVIWTADPSRRYKTSFITGQISNTSGSNNNSNSSIQDAAGTVLQQSTLSFLGFCTFHGFLVESGLSGQQTRKGYVYGQFAINVGAGTYLLVEDIGGI